MKQFSKEVVGRFTQLGAVTTLVLPAAVRAESAIQQGADAAKPTGAKENLFGNGSVFQSITNTLIFIVGAVAVLMLIIGGLRYVTSGGNSSSVEGAKNTILYAVIGIIVAILAYAIVNFVIAKVG